MRKCPRRPASARAPAKRSPGDETARQRFVHSHPVAGKQGSGLWLLRWLIGRPARRQPAAFDNKCRFRASRRPSRRKRAFSHLAPCRDRGVLRALDRQATAAPRGMQTGMRAARRASTSRSAKIPAFGRPGNGRGEADRPDPPMRTLLAALPLASRSHRCRNGPRGRGHAVRSRQFLGPVADRHRHDFEFRRRRLQRPRVIGGHRPGHVAALLGRRFPRPVRDAQSGPLSRLASMGLDRNISSVREIGGAPEYGGGAELVGRRRQPRPGHARTTASASPENRS